MIEECIMLEGRLWAVPRHVTIWYIRGKISLQNLCAMAYTSGMFRGTVESYQKWADDVGDPSYTFENILPYFMRSPQYTPPKPGMYSNSSNKENASAFSNSGGPLQVSFSNYVDPFSTWTQPALEAAGQSEIEGFNSGKLIGSAFVTFTIDPKNAHRSSSESSFLQSSLGKSMLQIYKGTLAQKILFDSNNKAKGVTVSTQSAYGTPTLNYTLSARKEVIVCAGAFQSPQLLMVSGVGPQASLEALNIPIVKNLPGVGQNMWDQIFFGTAFRVGVLTASAPQNNYTLALEAVQAYVQNASGPLSIFGGGYFGWEKLPEPYRSNLSASTQAALATFPADWPELEWIPVSAYLGYSRDYQTEDPKDGYNYATLATALVAPLSRGNITINSNSMEDPPVINPNWLTDPADIELAIAAFKRQRQVWTILNNLTIGEEQLPGPTVQSDMDILNFIRESLIQLYHPSATCKMGRANDTMAVIDSSARVYGTQGLRVVDASSFPFLPPGHPQATVYMLAEKIASEILAGH